ncbi:hypothetical protein P2Q00_39910 [Streptomyces coacervatus]|nr:hypothetical protein [Streptomyces coacervatus]MDF2271555.1 hypothetical protein [Streptomyces coacervatus]
MTNATAPGETRTSSPHPFDAELAAQWLALAHPSPRAARGEWSSAAKLAVLPLGRTFDAVRIPEDVVHAAAQSDEPSTTGSWLARHLSGPVIRDPGFRRYYVLVPPGTAQAWRARDTECLGDGTYLGVPRTDRIEVDERAPLAAYWSVPMARPGRLCQAADVLELVLLGHVLTGGDEA